MRQRNKHEKPQARRVLLLAARLGIAVIVLFIHTTEPNAKTRCDELSQLLFEIAVLSQAIYVAKDDNQAEIFESRLTLAFDKLHRSKFYQQIAINDNHERKSRIASFVDSRQKLLNIYRNSGIYTAKEFYFDKIIRLSYLKLTSTLDEINCMLDENDTDMEKLLNVTDKKQLLELLSESDITASGNNDETGENFSVDLWEIELDKGQSKYFLLALAILSVGIMFTIDFFESRKSSRHDVSIDAAVIFSGTTTPVRIGNLSLSGARFGPNPGLEIGNEITINLAHDPVGAQVMWASESAVGIMFAKKLKKHQMKSLMRAPGLIPGSGIPA